MPDFLDEQPGPRRWRLPDGADPGFEPESYFLGQGRNALEVAVATSTAEPSDGRVRALWKARHGNTPSPLLLVLLYRKNGTDRAAVCGPVGDDPAVHTGLAADQVERMAEVALAEPDRHSAIRFLSDSLQHVEAELPGLRNIGMFATHELKTGVPERPDWVEMQRRGQALLSKRGRDLVEALGFEIEPRGIATQVLRVRENGIAAAVAVFLERGESAETPSARFQDSSPVTHALARADQENLDYVVLTRGSEMRVYSARKHAGVGRKGRADTYVEVNLALLPTDQAGYVPLLFGATALEAGGTFEDVLEHSKDFSTDLGERLRDRVYVEVVPHLASAIGSAYRDVAGRDLRESDLPQLYEMAMTVLFRLLFIAYGEDKGLLPYETSGEYRRHALKTKARALAERANNGRLEFDPTSTDIWSDIRQLFAAIDKGNSDWAVPAYNGGLFSTDAATNLEGAELDRLQLTNQQMGPALFALLVDRSRSDEGYGPVDFRALSVREFGTIYEGLLEASLSLAPADLALDRESRYTPAADGQEVVVRQGEVYLQNQSGARKSTGSYFTKHFAVEHLLEKSLDPALDDHLQRVKALIDTGQEADAARAFFDFRCADLSMGSGHFLVAAVDHIEAKFSSFLARHPLRNVQAELERLRAAARDALGELGDVAEIEQSSLLRRQIARRCIYGADINEVAVELARLALWIHTFIPGLPLSFLNHNLVHGNSLTGIGTIEEAVQILDPESESGFGSLWRPVIEAWLEAAGDAFRRLGRIADATASEVKEAYRVQREAQAAVEPARNLFNMLVAHRAGEVSLPDLTLSDWEAHSELDHAGEVIRRLQAIHFPLQFPEVFLGNNPGFHCFLGNPPWEKLHVEEHTFWALRFPGLRALGVRQRDEEINRLRAEFHHLTEEFAAEVENSNRMREVLMRGPYPELGRGHPDLYKAFAWRFWQLAQAGGALGIVLPRTALVSPGTAKWRDAIMTEGRFSDLVLMENKRGWVFDDMEFRYTIALVAARKDPAGPHTARLRGPYRNLEQFYASADTDASLLTREQLLAASEELQLPLLPTRLAGEIFAKMVQHPRLDSPAHAWHARPVQGDVNASTGKKDMVINPVNSSGLWPVYSGASFNLWEPDTGNYYAWADPHHIISVLQDKRLRQHRTASSAFSGFPRSWAVNPDTLPCRNVRIAFRDVTSRTNTRTVIAALIPPDRILQHTAPYLLRIRGSEADEAYLLGILSSIPLDWFARRLVETHVTFGLIQGFPIPSQRDGVALRVTEIAGRLAAGDERFSEWAAAVGVPVASVGEDEKDDLTAELDALVAHLYGLTAEELTHMFQTFHEGWDYTERLERALVHHDSISVAV